MNGELIVLYKSPAAVSADWRAFFATSKESLRRIGGDPLTKIVTGHVSSAAVAARAMEMSELNGAGWVKNLAKARAQLEKSRGAALAKIVAVDDEGAALEKADRLVKWLADFNSEYEKIKRLEKRSARFAGFAGGVR